MCVMFRAQIRYDLFSLVTLILVAILNISETSTLQPLLFHGRQVWGTKVIQEKVWGYQICLDLVKVWRKKTTLQGNVRSAFKFQFWHFPGCKRLNTNALFLTCGSERQMERSIASALQTINTQSSCSYYIQHVGLHNYTSKTIHVMLCMFYHNTKLLE